LLIPFLFFAGYGGGFGGDPGNPNAAHRRCAPIQLGMADKL
jgi:hypothetical protein